MNYQVYKNKLSKLEELDNLRELKELRLEGKYVYRNGKKLLNLSSNDYLGVAMNGALRSDFTLIKPRLPYGSTSSRLLNGNSEEHVELENQLGELYGQRSALLFNSGYHANVGIIPALCTKNDLIVADKLVHASIIDGMRLSEATSVRFRHNDYKHLVSILEKEAHNYQNVFIITESLFSMDGDTANLEKLLEIKHRFNAFLYVDEAHAVGVFGPNGLGVAEEQYVLSEIDFLVGTFGKAYGSQGAFVICDELFRDYLINHCRSLIFSTALPPINAAWTSLVLTKITAMHKERNHLKELSQYFTQILKQKNYRCVSKSQIIPLIVKENENAVQLSEKLIENGFWVLPLRPPTVPKGSARLRFTLNSMLTKSDLDNVLDLIPDNQ